MEHGAHDLCADTCTTREQCHLPGPLTREALLRLSGQHHQGRWFSSTPLSPSFSARSFHGCCQICAFIFVQVWQWCGDAQWNCGCCINSKSLKHYSLYLWCVMCLLHDCTTTQYHLVVPTGCDVYTCTRMYHSYAILTYTQAFFPQCLSLTVLMLATNAGMKMPGYEVIVIRTSSNKTGGGSGQRTIKATPI